MRERLDAQGIRRVSANLAADGIGGNRFLGVARADGRDLALESGRRGPEALRGEQPLRGPGQDVGGAGFVPSLEGGPGLLESLGVPVQAEKPPVGCGRAQQCGRVAAEAHGAVHPETARSHREELQRLGEENARVTRIRFHTPRGASRPRP